MPESINTGHKKRRKVWPKNTERKETKMNKNELISAIAEKTPATKADAEKFIDAFTQTVTEELAAGGSIRIVGFGTFESVERPARKGRNPQTGEEVEVKASRIPKFKAGKLLKESVRS